ncbi:MAG: NnrS family protein [Moraxellaceae bacterium]|nr:NnrS family protein [Moraxellaceae bacterium]
MALMQIEDAGEGGGRPSWNAFLEMGFRPLYLAGCAWAAIAVLVWIFAPHWLVGTLGGVAWHAHEMLWGFVATIAVGFLLTASANWTNRNPLQGPALGGLLAVWLVARVAFLLPGAKAFGFGVLAELLFFLVAVVAVARVIILARSRRNYFVPVLLAALGVADLLFLLAVAGGDYAALMRHVATGMLVMSVLTLLVARRVIPFFASRAVPGLQIPMHERSGHWQLVVASIAVLCALLQWSWPMAVALLIAGVIGLVQVLAWQPRAVLGRPLLWVLYLGYAMLAVGLIVAAVQALGVGRAALPLHLIGIGGFSLLIIGMVTRTALGHSGRALQTDRSMVASYVCVALALVLRLAALWPSAWVLGLWRASALLWGLAFALYLWRFTPWLVSPRADAGKRVIPVSAAAPRQGA